MVPRLREVKFRSTFRKLCRINLSLNFRGPHCSRHGTQLAQRRNNPPRSVEETFGLENFSNLEGLDELHQRRLPNFFVHWTLIPQTQNQSGKSGEKDSSIQPPLLTHDAQPLYHGDYVFPVTNIIGATLEAAHTVSRIINRNDLPLACNHFHHLYIRFTKN